MRCAFNDSYDKNMPLVIEYEALDVHALAMRQWLMTPIQLFYRQDPENLATWQHPSPCYMQEVGSFRGVRGRLNSHTMMKSFISMSWHWRLPLQMLCVCKRGCLI